MADNRDNLDDFDLDPETAPVLYQDETQTYEPEPPVQIYSADDIAAPPPRNWTGILLAALIVVAVLLAALLGYLFFGRDDSTLLPGTTAAPIPTDGSWERVRLAGRMVVGTSLDYPPFSYRDEQFQPTGFDMALIREISGRLGVGTDIRDIAFDSLFTALDQQQIDVAIAAISVTPEREALVNFSNVYYVGEEGILAQANSAITSIISLSDMAGRRIGVQRGSVYETWLQRDLVDSGLTVAGNLFVYETVDAAVRDLREQRLDLAVVDSAVAQAAVAQGGVRRVGGGLNKQRYAIAVRRGADALRAQLNAALTQMQNDGRLSQLAQTYLNLDPNVVVTLPAPTATSSVPTAIPPTAPPTGCVNGMRFVADLNLDDNNMQSPPPISPGQAFSKGWRIQNSGTCAWTTGYRLAFVDGNTPAASMGGQPTPIQGFVQAGQQYDIFVNLIAPLAPGVYQGIWQMVDDQNRPFGDRIWVGITVPASATATPQPTQTPSPSIDFRVDRNNILQGECVNFNWNVQGARAVYFYTVGEAWQNSQVPPQSSRQVCPANTTTFYLRVVRNDGNVEERQQPITVRPNVNAPTIAQFVGAPSQVTVGQCVQLQWDVQGSVTRVTLSNQFRVIWDNAPSRGNTQDCTGAPATIEYKLVGTGPGGTSQALEYVTVVSPATATPVPTTVPSQPIIDTFTVVPGQIQVAECVQISWSTSGATWLVRLLRNNVLVLDNANLVGAVQDCLQYPGTYTYQLVASTANGQSISRDQSVRVSEVPQVNPLAGRTFAVTAVNSSAVLPDSVLSVTFNAEGQVSGSGGCNNYNGRYTASGTTSNGQITVSELSSSNQLCGEPPGMMTQELDYFNALRAAATYEFVTDAIVIFRNAVGQEVVRLGPTIQPR